MSARIEKSWSVLASHQTSDGGRCVDVFRRQDDTFGFEEFRKDPEDMGAWTPVGYYSTVSYPTAQAALDEAQLRVRWLSEALGHER